METAFLSETLVKRSLAGEYQMEVQNVVILKKLKIQQIIKKESYEINFNFQLVSVLFYL